MIEVRRFSFLWLAAAVVLVGCQPEAADESGNVVGARQTSLTQEVKLARGEYLVNHVGICFYCHSEIDWQAPGFPQIAGTRGGGAVFPEEGVPGLAVSRNITPYTLGDCTDEEIARAIREGAGCDGTRLFPVMPYFFFNAMSDEDVLAVVAYLRTLEPIENELARTEIPEEVWATIPPAPPITEPVETPDPADEIAYGGYLATIGLCVECHTPLDPMGAPIQPLAFAGGRVLEGPWGRVATANLTSAPSGIPYYDEQTFREALRTCKVGARQLNHLMPCEFYKGMTDEDISAIFAFLKSLDPIEHSVSNVDDPTPCRRCGLSHGLGERNQEMSSVP